MNALANISSLSGLSGLAAAPSTSAAIRGAAGDFRTKAKAVSEQFEAVFLNTMMQPMFAGANNGPFSGGPAAGVWRSMLTDEYAKSFASTGGIGIADHIYKSLIAAQEGRPGAPDSKKPEMASGKYHAVAKSVVVHRQ